LRRSLWFLVWGLAGCGGTETNSADSSGASHRELATTPFLAPPGAASTQATRPEDINWLDLMPDSERRALESGNWAGDEIDHEADTGMAQFGSAATVAAMAGRSVRIPGYVVPVDVDTDQQMRSFLFVPYYGACIHVPPPPPNQLVFGTLETPIEIPSTWDAYWLSGILRVDRIDAAIATASYRMERAQLRPWDDE